MHGAQIQLLQENLCPNGQPEDCACQVVPAPDFPPEVQQQWDRCQWILYRLRRAHLDGPPAQPAQALASAGDFCGLLSICRKRSCCMLKLGANNVSGACFLLQATLILNRKGMPRDHDGEKVCFRGRVGRGMWYIEG